MKKNLLLISCCVLTLGFYSCSTSKVEKADTTNTIENNSNVDEITDRTTDTVTESPLLCGVQLANPYFDFSSLEEAADMAGFSMTLPDAEELPDWIIKIDYRATKSDLMEIIYAGDENYTKEIRLRKAITDQDDISGDYNTYEEEPVIEIEGKNIKVRINDGKYYVATWKDNGFAYSLSTSEGMTLEDIERLVSLIK